MAMSWTSLTAAKGTAGSIANWVSYSLLDITTILDEAQSLLYSMLRVREMRTHTVFTMAVGGAWQTLPARFLDPIGSMQAVGFNYPFIHKDIGFINENRNFSETTGTFLASPVATTSGSSIVTLTLASHGFSQDSTINLVGATAVGGIMIDGTYEIYGVPTTNTFTVDFGTAASGTASGGGSALTYTCDNLTEGTPQFWAIDDGRIRFDQAFNTTTLCRLNYYQSLALLSASNLTNFLTDRYPHFLRKACQASAADFMKDDGEYQKCLASLTAMIGSIQVESDFEYRGADISAETPGGSGLGFAI